MNKENLSCRINDRNAPNIMVNALGDVSTPLKQGVLDPENDRIVLDGGEAIDNYYKETLGVSYFKPLDKPYMKSRLRVGALGTITQELSRRRNCL